jgi:signal peptidase I
MTGWWDIRVTGWLRFLVGRRPAVTVLRLGVVLALYFGVFRPFFQPIRVTGVSMEPTYHDGGIKLLHTRAYRRTAPARFDVVAVKVEDTLRVILKRVVGLPGETVAVRGGRVYIDGQRLEEPYASGRGIPSTPEPVRLGPDEYFAIGDNRQVSAYGVVRREEILGRTH